MAPLFLNHPVLMMFPKDPALKNAVAFLVSANIEKTVRVKITTRESQIELIDRLARQAGMTWSAFMVLSPLAVMAGKLLVAVNR